MYRCTNIWLKYYIESNVLRYRPPLVIILIKLWYDIFVIIFRTVRKKMKSGSSKYAQEIETTPPVFSWSSSGGYQEGKKDSLKVHLVNHRWFLRGYVSNLPAVVTCLSGGRHGEGYFDDKAIEHEHYLENHPAAISLGFVHHVRYRLYKRSWWE